MEHNYLGPAIVRINLFVRSIATISDIKMVSGPVECGMSVIVRQLLQLDANIYTLYTLLSPYAVFSNINMINKFGTFTANSSIEHSE